MKSIIDEYLERVRAGKYLPRDYDQGDIAEIVRYLVEREQIDPRELSTQFLREHRLLSLFLSRFRGSIWELAEKCWPGRYRPWEFRKSHVPNDYWQGDGALERAAEATRWLAETLVAEGTPPQKVLRRMTTRAFKQHGLGGMLVQIFGGSAKKAVENMQEFETQNRISVDR